MVYRKPLCSSVHSRNSVTFVIDFMWLYIKFTLIYYCSSLSLSLSLSLSPLLSSPPHNTQCYNPQSKQWTTVAPLPIQRSGFGSAVVDSTLYLAGGCNNLSKVSTVDKYDPEKDEWTSVARMSVRRSGLGVGVAPAFLF